MSASTPALQTSGQVCQSQRKRKGWRHHLSTVFIVGVLALILALDAVPVLLGFHQLDQESGR